MGNVVYKLTSKEIQSLMAQTTFETTKLPQGMKARTRYQGTVINIYSSGKVMFQGKNGSDEAGSGDYFGPLTVCAAYVSQSHIKILKELGVDDSKKLNDTKIVDLAEQLITFIPHSLLTLDNVKYNERQSLGWSQVKMKAVLHNEAIKNVIQKIEQDQLDYIVIDQFAKREVYQHYALSALPFPDKTKFETKGESKSLAIATASIISRYAFVKHMDHISKKLHMEIPKGASNKVDLIAAKVIQKYDIQQLDTISKKHFKNRDKAIHLINQKYNK